MSPQVRSTPYTRPWTLQVCNCTESFIPSQLSLREKVPTYSKVWPLGHEGLCSTPYLISSRSVSCSCNHMDRWSNTKHVPERPCGHSGPQVSNINSTLKYIIAGLPELGRPWPRLDIQRCLLPLHAFAATFKAPPFQGFSPRKMNAPEVQNIFEMVLGI